MITDRIFTPGLAQVAYLIADEEAVWPPSSTIAATLTSMSSGLRSAD